MTKKQHPLQHFAVRLLIGLMTLSLLSMLGLVAAAFKRAQSVDVASAAPSVPFTHTSAGVHSLATTSFTPKTPESAQNAQNTLKTEVLQANSTTQKLPAEKKGGDPLSQAPAAPLLKLNISATHIHLALNTDQLNETQQLRVLTRLLLLPYAPNEESLLASQGIPLLQLPYFYKRVLDGQGRPIRYPYQATRFAQQLLAQAPEVQRWRKISIHLKPAWQVHKAKAWSSRLSQVGLTREQALLLAIMEVESGFNPKARSRTGAIGLMQLKPDQAVQDVAKHLGREIPTDALYDAHTNLTVGAHYVRLLQNQYLAQVRNPQSREYLTIAAYNGGINAVLKQFGRTHAQAIERINRLSPQTVYRILRYQFPRDETRRYLEKVVQAKARYQQWIKDNVI